MDHWKLVVFATLAVYAVLGVGAAARRLNWLTAEADRALIALVVRVLLPALILKVILGNPRLRDPVNLTLPPLVGVATTLLGFVVAWVAVRWFGHKMGLTTSAHRRAFVLCVGIHNYGYLPIPLSEALFGAESSTTGVLLVHNIGVEITLWTAGVMIASGAFSRAAMREHGLKQLFNPVLIAIALALAANFTGIDAHVPQFVHGVLDLLARAAVPLSLILTGATIADVYRESRLHHGTAVMGAACLLRLAVLPLAFIAIAWAMPAEWIELKRVTVIEGAMPAAIFPIVLARHYGADVPTAVRVVLGTSIAGLVTIPLWISYGLGWLRLM